VLGVLLLRVILCPVFLGVSVLVFFSVLFSSLPALLLFLPCDGCTLGSSGFELASSCTRIGPDAVIDQSWRTRSGGLEEHPRS
jgi:hypothetical protein